ncbi:hypothetical protein GCM10010252_53320 [Streptomyces aureoverticillatus]|nr:hypothetical protein GCM10010252_53320 [Streptomyces aureoverticillatus]
MRTGEAAEGVVGLRQTGIPDDRAAVPRDARHTRGTTRPGPLPPGPNVADLTAATIPYWELRARSPWPPASRSPS